MTLKLLALLTLLTCTISVRLYDRYREFKVYQRQFQRKYSCIGEEFYRLMVYSENLELIQRLNMEDQATGVYGITQFTDMTRAQMLQHAGLRIPDNHQLRFAANFTDDLQYKPKKDIPDIWNWTQLGAVTGVKNQGSCGSCWSFSAAGNIEGQYYLHHNKELIDFSEQQMIDCDVTNFGCNGGWPFNAFDFLAINGGLQTQKTYPLRSDYIGPCQFDPSKAKVQLKGYMNISQSQDIIKDALYQKGPLSILLDFQGLFHYKAGVASPRLCGTWPNHALVLVGYGTKNQNYWLIKNSWGPKWGINGYLMLKRGAKKCGIDHWAITGVLRD